MFLRRCVILALERKPSVLRMWLWLYKKVGKGIYTYYKNRLVEIGGGNKCLCLKSVVRKGAYDVGRIFTGREGKIAELIDTLWSGRHQPITLLSEKELSDISENMKIPDEESDEADSEAKAKTKKAATRIKMLESELLNK